MMANRILRSREWIKERGLRPSPSDSATVFDEGDLKLGNDGFHWIIIVDKNGCHRWKRLK